MPGSAWTGTLYGKEYEGRNKEEKKRGKGVIMVHDGLNRKRLAIHLFFQNVSASMHLIFVWRNLPYE